MPVPVIVWGIGLVVAGGWALSEAGEAIDASTRLTRTLVVAGGLYVSYRALQSTGALK